MSRTVFLDKTLLAAANIAEQSLFSEFCANRQGLLQTLDVRIKLLTFLLILVLISFLHLPQTLWIVYGLSLLLAVLSRVPLAFFMKRVWLFVPLFSAAVVLPAVLNIITPGDPLVTLVRFNGSFRFGPVNVPAEITVTLQGVQAAVIFVSRVAASVSFAVLFTLTTRWSDVFSGLRGLLVPRVFVVTLGMAYRYLFVLLRLVQEMYRGRKSRTIRPLSPRQERSWTASRIGTTFKRSLDMSEDIYKAMLSRGFRGEYRALNRFRVSVADTAWILSLLVISGLLILSERGVFHL